MQNQASAATKAFANDVKAAAATASSSLNGVAAKGMGGGDGGGVFAPQITITMNVQGSSGDKGADDAYLARMGGQLNAVMDDKINAWATNQTRPGGVLARRK